MLCLFGHRCYHCGQIRDMSIIQPNGGKGLGIWLMECMVQPHKLSYLRRILLNTRDARELRINYTKFGH